MKTTAEMLAEAAKDRVTVTASTAPPKAPGEVVLLPGVRPPKASS